MKTTTLQETGRITAGAYYDYQSIRISTLNRIRDVIRKRNENIPFNEVEEKKEKKKFSKDYEDKSITKLLKKMEKEKKLTKKEQKYLEKTFEIAKKSNTIEREYKKLMLEYVKEEILYTEFLQKIRGIGEVLSANLLKEFVTVKHTII